MSTQISNKNETIKFLEDESKIKDSEMEELSKDVKHLMDERAKMQKKIFKLDQQVKGYQQITIKDYKQKVSKKVNFILLLIL